MSIQDARPGTPNKTEDEALADDVFGDVSELPEFASSPWEEEAEEEAEAVEDEDAAFASDDSEEPAEPAEEVVQPTISLEKSPRPEAAPEPTEAEFTPPPPRPKAEAPKSYSAPHIRAAVHAFRSIGAPLLAAVAEVRALAVDDANGTKQEGDAAAFAQLVAGTSTLARAVAEKLGAEKQGNDDWMRWSMAGAASSVMSAYYRATGKPDVPTEAEAFAAAVEEAAKAASEEVPALPDAVYSTAQLRTKILSSMAPVVAAVARYAFGRQEQALVGEIATRIQKTSIEVAQVLVPADAPPEEWRLVYCTALEVAGHLYAEAHYAEADRLVEMTPEERAAYLARNKNEVPMEPVWTAFDMNLAMLTALAGFLKVPEQARLDELKVG